MKAAVFSASDGKLEVTTVPDPQPGPGEVILAVARCGVCGSDLHILDGNGPVLAGERIGGQREEGVILGHEYAGTVVAIGAEVRGVALGDQLVPMAMSGCGACAACRAGRPMFCRSVRPMMGGFAEYAAVRPQFCAILPPSIPLADGALVEPMACGLHAVHRADVGPGSRVLVLGAGAIALAVAFWAKRAGAQVVVSSRSRASAEVAADLGGDHFLLSGDLAATLPDVMAEPDIIFECTGAGGMFDRAVQLIRPEGCVVMAGMCCTPDSVSHAPAVVKEIQVRYAVAYRMEEYLTVISALEQWGPRFSACISRAIALEELPAAIDALRAGKIKSKVMVDPGAA